MNKMIKWLGNYWISGAAVIMLGFSIALNFGNFSSNDTGIILTFVGILATFIVVGNYAQVMTIRDDSKETIKETKDKISKALEEMRTDFEKRIIEINEENSKLTKTIEDSNKKLELIIDCTQLYLEGMVMITLNDSTAKESGLEMIIKTVERSLENKLPSLLVPSLSILNSYQNSSYFNIFINHIEDFKSFKKQFPNNPELSPEKLIIDNIICNILNHQKINNS